MDISIKEFPEQIRIENTTLCNARCTICPREKLTRPSGTMSFEDFRAIIDQCNHERLNDLHLQGFGEPLLDRDFVKKVRYAREKLPLTRLFFVTNASLLKGGLAKEIILSGVDKIKVSFYGTDAAEYEKIHKPLCYADVRANILEFLRLKKQLGSKKPAFSVKYIGSLPGFLRFALQWLGKARVEFSRVHNYSTGRRFNRPASTAAPLCPMVSRPIMQVLWNGDVVPCCYDFNGAYIIGNALRDGLRQVWLSEKYNALRRLNAENAITSIPMCAECDKVK
jgi:radical SAM protein with 4Fe4S-binding SPASM domain